MSIAFSDLGNFALETVNASSPASAYGVLVSERYKSPEFDFSCRITDISCARMVIADPNDGRRAQYLTSSAVAHGDFVPNHVGPIDAVWFSITGGYYSGTRGVEPRPVSYLNQLEMENRNPEQNPLIEPHVVIEDDTVFHNAAGLVAGGASAASLFVRYATLTYSSGGTNILSPDEFARAIACGALAILMMKDGQRTGAGQMFQSMYLAELKMLGVQSPEPLEVASEQQQAA